MASSVAMERPIPLAPPTTNAVATPAILPVPTVAASAVHTAWNGVIAPVCASPFLNTFFRHTDQKLNIAMFRI